VTRLEPGTPVLPGTSPPPSRKALSLKVDANSTDLVNQRARSDCVGPLGMESGLARRSGRGACHNGIPTWNDRTQRRIGSRVYRGERPPSTQGVQPGVSHVQMTPLQATSILIVNVNDRSYSCFLSKDRGEVPAALARVGEGALSAKWWWTAP